MKPLLPLDQRQAIWNARKAREKQAEEAYVSKQIKLIRWPSLIISLMMLVFFVDSVGPKTTSKETIDSVVTTSEGPVVVKVSFGSGNFYTTLKNTPIPKANESIELKSTFILGEIVKATTSNATYIPELLFANFYCSHLAGFGLLMYSYIANRTHKKYWFQTWILGIVSVLISAIGYIVSY